MSEPGPVRLRLHGPVAEIVLTRPERRNALDAAAGAALADTVERIHARDDIRAVVLRGGGTAFCAGGDVKAMAAGAGQGKGPATVREIAAAVHAAIVALARLPKPVVASVRGAAHGAGFSLALACDLVVAAEDATFCQAFVNVGATPDSGSTFFLPRIVGPRLAAELIMLGEPIGAARAYQLGLVNRVVPGGELDAHVRVLAERLARGPVRALAYAKRLIGASWRASLEEQLEEERRALGEAAATADFRDGVAAFAGRRRTALAAGAEAEVR